MKKSVLAFFTVFQVIMFSVAAQSPIRIMILDGESIELYHHWELNTPILKMILDEPGKFVVDVVTAPPAGGDFSNFMPKFSNYRAVILNYDAPTERWPEALKKSFEQYISGGGGLVTIHAADNAFPGWTEFNKMIGVGGWRNRNEKSGPYWYYKDGKLVSDMKPGNAGSHGARIPFLMKVVNPDHPVTRGLPRSWMHQGDELYAQLRGPGENMNVLVTAYSDKTNRGTGFDEPQLIAISYGKGRVFHYTPGHDAAGMASVDYVVLLQRGTEWAATGKVTQKVPADFPTATTVSYRVNIASMDPNYKSGFGGVTGGPRPGPPGGAPRRDSTIINKAVAQ